MYKFLRFTIIMAIIAMMMSACAPATPEVTEAPEERGTFRQTHFSSWGGEE